MTLRIRFAALFRAVGRFFAVLLGLEEVPDRVCARHPGRWVDSGRDRRDVARAEVWVVIVPDVPGRYCLILCRCLAGGMSLAECSCLIDDLGAVLYFGGRAVS